MTIVPSTGGPGEAHWRRMTDLLRPALRRALLAGGIAVLLAACNAGSPPPSASPSIETTVTGSAAPSASPEPTPSATATVEPTATPTTEPTASPTPTTADDAGELTVAPNPEADTLFLERDTCENLRDGYQLEFPEDWYTNTEIGRFPPCIWFSPDFYTVPDPTQVPDEIAIEIEYMEGDSGSFEDPISREFVVVGGQDAVRVEYEDSYLYQIQLGRTPEEGPNLVVRTTTEMGGDYELNKAVLDRMMATIEFVGSIQ
jgi:hypothetical protein